MAEIFEEYSIGDLKEMQRESGVSNSKRLISILMRKLEFMEGKIATLETEIPKKIQVVDESPFWDGEPSSLGVVPFPITGISDGHAKELFDEIGGRINQRIEVLSGSDSKGTGPGILERGSRWGWLGARFSRSLLASLLAPLFRIWVP